MRARLQLAGLCCCVAAWAESPVTFDDSAGDRLRIFTDSYELALSKTKSITPAATRENTKTPKAHQYSRSDVLRAMAKDSAPPTAAS